MRRCTSLFLRPALVARSAAVSASVSSARLVAASAVPSAARLLHSSAVARFDDKNSGSGSGGFVPKPVFSSFKIYKTKTALDIAVVRAQLAWNAGPERKYLSLRRAGGFRLTFAAGERNKGYEWEAAQLFQLSVIELGDLLAFDKNKEAVEHKFFHDPGMGSDMAGKVRKELIVKRIGGGKPGYFFNLAVTNPDEAESVRKFSISVSEGEWNVLLALIQQTMPDLLALSTKAQLQREDQQQQGGEQGGNDGAQRTWKDAK
jgi:hypothetical protein